MATSQAKRCSRNSMVLRESNFHIKDPRKTYTMPPNIRAYPCLPDIGFRFYFATVR
jgi:hypothetical protein